MPFNFYISTVKLLKEHSLFICVLLACTLLRFLPLFDYQYTYDELSGLERTQFNSFSEVIEKGVKIDAHPALIQLLIYYLVKIFGYSTWIIKLPFLLFSLGAITYAYAFGLRNFSKQAGLFSALLLGFSLIFVFYAPIARMYISGVFFSIALLYYFFGIFFLKNLSWRNYFFLGLFALLSALNQHINSLFAFTVCASGFFFLDKKNYKAYLIMCGIVVLAYLPHLSVTLYQLSIPGIGVENGGWLEAPEFSVLFFFIKILFGTGKTYLLIIVLLVLSFMLNKSVSVSKKQAFLLFLFLFNFLVVYFYSIWRSPIFQYSVMLFSGSALVLFICSFLNFKSKIILNSALVIVASVLLYKTYLKKDYFNQAVKTVYEYQFERTIHYKNLYGNKNVFPVFFDADEIMKKIYFEKYKTNFDCVTSADSIISNMERAHFDRVNGEEIIEKVSSQRLFSEFISNLKTDYIVLSSAMPQHQAVVLEHFPYLIENTQTQAINYKVYSRKKEDQTIVVADDHLSYFSSLNERGNFIYSKANTRESNKFFVLKVDSFNEFPFDAKAVLHEVTEREGQVVLAKAVVKIKNNYSPLEVCISVNDQKTNEQYAYNGKAASDYLMNKDSTTTIYSEHFNGFNYDRIKYKSNITCYLWNRGKENFELIDFEIKVIDYWPRKWDWWD
ncbi:glycosyltransferase family 39 protein [Aurantibacillus circumpalustris]|uniref:glycosyltransferase family 39 protein n=1 Tax=Aurantibacillus circumpalustris TaxID=3036359 RepID=UPI00295B02EB|nr:glycosyltransferase family 39 protein [Aurantibacillus circumpalustris]